MGAKERTAALKRLETRPGGPPLLAVATGPYAGEGFDCPALDTRSARNITGEPGDLAGDIGRAVLASLHGPRRPRVCARRVKSPLSRWNKHPPGKPRTNLKITSVITVTSQYRDEKKTRRRRSLTPAPGP
jgi:hypothetical protein